MVQVFTLFFIFGKYFTIYFHFYTDVLLSDRYVNGNNYLMMILTGLETKDQQLHMGQDPCLTTPWEAQLVIFELCWLGWFAKPDYSFILRIL